MSEEKELGLEEERFAIVRLRIENLMRIELADITPPGKGIVLVSGKNGAGKTSVLESFMMAAGGKRFQPPEPIREGQKRAEVLAELVGDNGTELTVTGRWHRKRGTGDTEFAVEIVPKGGRSLGRPYDVLQQFFSLTSFDPLEFVRVEGPKQAQMLKDLLGLTEAFERWDAERKKLYDERTVANREVDRAKAQLAGCPDPGDIAAVSVAALAEAHCGAVNQQRANDRKRQELADAETIAERTGAEIDELNRRLAALRLRHGQELEQVDALATKVSGLVEPNMDDIAKQLAEAEETNKRADQHAKYVELAKTFNDATGRSETLTAQIGEIDQQKADALVAAEMPVVGLSLGEAGVEYQGRPLCQLSHWEQNRVSAAVGAAMNPRLNAMFIRQGSLADDDSLHDLAEFAEAYGIQIWVESVLPRDGFADYVVRIEEGRVVEQGAA